MPHYLGKGILVSDAVFSDMNYIKCNDCFMSHDFPIVPGKGIVSKNMEVSVNLEDSKIDLGPGESFKDLKKLKDHHGIDLFCGCGSLLRSWGPEDVMFDAKRPKGDLGSLSDQMDEGILPVLYWIVRMIWGAILAFLGF